MADIRLTKKQDRLLKEIKKLSKIFLLDYQDIEEYKGEERTAHLEYVKDRIIRSHIISTYILIDELLSREICKFFFKRRGGGRQRRGMERFQNFNDYIIEELSLLQKLKMVKAIKKIPKRISEDIEQINSLRNGLSHSFFPDVLRRHRPDYKGKDIFKLEGVESYQRDCTRIIYFLTKGGVRELI